MALAARCCASPSWQAATGSCPAVEVTSPTSSRSSPSRSSPMGPPWWSASRRRAGSPAHRAARRRHGVQSLAGRTFAQSILTVLS
ncbi:MAG: hypothetical protein ACK559_13245, partial [bacterium]